MAITGSIQEKNSRYYMVINMPTENGKTKPMWRATGLKVRGNKKEAERMLNERLNELNKYGGVYCKLTVAEYFKDWLKRIEKEVRPNTYRSYYGNMTNHIIPYFEKHNMKLQDLKPYHLEEYYKSKQQADSKLSAGGALSNTTIKHHHQNISKALSDALRRGIIRYNPAANAKTPKAEKYRGDYLSMEQVRELLTLVKGSPIELPVILGAVYGFRRSEIVGLKWSSIDFTNRTITISETLQQNTGGNYTDKPKTESSYRTLPMTESIYNILQTHKALQKERERLMGDSYSISDYVCTRANGEVITPNYLTKTFKAIIGKSVLPQIRFHDLRHSAATNLIASGRSVVDVQEWLGHANASTTLDIYSHASKTAKEEIASELEKLIPLT